MPSGVLSLKSNCGPGDMKKKMKSNEKKREVQCVCVRVCVPHAFQQKPQTKKSHAKSKKNKKIK